MVYTGAHMESGKHVRIDEDVHARLKKFSEAHPYRASMQAIVSYAVSRWLDKEEKHLEMDDISQGG